MTISIRRWIDEQSNEPSIEAIRKLNQPPSKYRITEYRYPAGAVIHGSMRAVRAFVVDGSCQFALGTGVTLHRGDIADIPEGSYSLEALGIGDLAIVFCWELPQAVR